MLCRGHPVGDAVTKHCKKSCACQRPQASGIHEKDFAARERHEALAGKCVERPGDDLARRAELGCEIAVGDVDDTGFRTLEKGAGEPFGEGVEDGVLEDEDEIRAA